MIKLTREETNEAYRILAEEDRTDMEPRAYFLKILRESLHDREKSRALTARTNKVMLDIYDKRREKEDTE